MLALYFVLFVVLSTINGTASLTCVKCANASSLRECRLTEQCADGQVCYQKREYTNQVQYSLGCVDKENCGRQNKIENASNVSKLNADEQTSNCYECCSKDMCNKKICDYQPNSQCKDEKFIDCARFNSMFNICEDKHEAKKICPRFCNLCDLVDGNWSPWSLWSSCDVTCGKGSLLRHRSCTNPAPENGGLDCQGKRSEMKPCYLELCPVHGGWSVWDNWGTCSVTCGVGMRNRTRSCTSPRPERFGNHCFGDRHEVAICQTESCTRKVAFYAYIKNDDRHYPEGRVIVFPIVNLNDGKGYNSSSGIFKAPVNGVYQFTAHVCHFSKKYMIVAIIKGTKQIAVTAGFENLESDCTSVSAISRVKENENVFVMARWTNCRMFSNTHRWPSFSGILMYQDD